MSFIVINVVKAAQEDLPGVLMTVQRLGLDASQVQVDVEGDTVHLKGNAPDAETHEKLVLAAGNVAGIAKVDDNLATAAGAGRSAAGRSGGNGVNRKASRPRSLPAAGVA